MFNTKFMMMSIGAIFVLATVSLVTFQAGQLSGMDLMLDFAKQERHMRHELQQARAQLALSYRMYDDAMQLAARTLRQVKQAEDAIKQQSSEMVVTWQNNEVVLRGTWHHTGVDGRVVLHAGGPWGENCRHLQQAPVVAQRPEESDSSGTPEEMVFRTDEALQGHR